MGQKIHHTRQQSTIAMQTSWIEEWHDDDHQNEPMKMIKQLNHASYVIII
jgi:hypothetical protein